MRSVAKVDASAGFGMKFVPIPRIPGVNYLSDVQAMVYNLDPRELRRINAGHLRDMGVGEEVIESFLDNAFLRPSQQSVFVAALFALEGVLQRLAYSEDAEAKEVWLLGGISPRCREELEHRGWIVRSDIPIPEA